MWKARALFRLPAGISEPMVVIAQTGSEAVSHVTKTLLVVKEKPVHAHRGPAEVCLFPTIFPPPWETFTSREEFTLTLF